MVNQPDFRPSQRLQAHFEKIENLAGSSKQRNSSLFRGLLARYFRSENAVIGELAHALAVRSTIDKDNRVLKLVKAVLERSGKNAQRAYQILCRIAFSSSAHDALCDRLFNGVNVAPGFEVPTCVYIHENQPRIESGYYRTTYNDTRTGKKNCRMIIASVSAAKIEDLFYDLTCLFGKRVRIVLEKSHKTPGKRYSNYWTSKIDLCVAQNHLIEMSELILKDGGSGITIIGKTRDSDGKKHDLQIRVTPQKYFMVYSEFLEGAQKVLEAHAIAENQNLTCVKDIKHSLLTSKA